MSDFVNKTIGQLVKDTATRYPENIALISLEFGIRQTYREFYKTCRDVAKGLMAMGIKGAIMSPSGRPIFPNGFILQSALGMTGGILVTINTNYQTHELEYILKQSDSTSLFLIDSYRDTSFYDTVRQIVPELDYCTAGSLVSEKLPLLKNVIYIGKKENTPGMFKFSDLIKMGEKITEQELDDRMNSLSDDDVINMQYTSGTTGFPKGVMLTHHNIVNNARMVGDVMGMTEKDSLLIQVPMFHCFGCVMSTLNCLYHGSTMVILESFDALKALQFIASERCTAVNGVPTMFVTMLNHPDFDKYDMSSLRTGIMAGALCPEETMNQVRTKMHCSEIVIAFGQTESSPVMTMTRRDDPVKLRVASGRQTSTGY